MKEYTFPVEEKEDCCVAEPEVAYQTAKHRYTYADYLSWDDDVRRELIDGFVYELSAPTLRHARLSQRLSLWLGSFITRRKGKCEVFYAPFDVRLSRTGETADDKIETVVQPDICVICDPSKLDKDGCLGAPDLIVEILSPSTSGRDLNEKFRLYEATGVREYWIVFPDKDVLKVFILQNNGKYNNGTVYVKKGKAPVHIFEGLSIDLKKLFA
ncbi:MAG: Uma2 family endonuclease [Prevotellaceae bacterium]|jgi:Uma2 family endonuclease|nr:Uma2 family endonuclease [Prevotellaceae bacterium]